MLWRIKFLQIDLFIIGDKKKIKPLYFVDVAHSLTFIFDTDKPSFESNFGSKTKLKVFMYWLAIIESVVAIVLTCKIDCFEFKTFD